MILSSGIVTGIQALNKLNVILPVIQEFSITEVFKCLLNIYLYRVALGEENMKRINWLQGYMAVTLSGGAGAITMALLKGKPFEIINRTEYWITYGVMYWLLMDHVYFFNLLHYLFHNFTTIKYLLIGITSINKGYSLVRVGIEAEDKLVAKVICGVLISCAGALWIELFSLDKVEWKFSTPSRFLKPADSVKVSLWTILFYLILSLFIENRDEAHTIGAIFYTTLVIYNSHRHHHKHKSVKKPVEIKNELKKTQ